jgi:hypothetical protein
LVLANRRRRTRECQSLDPIFQILRTVPPLAGRRPCCSASDNLLPYLFIFITAIWPVLINLRLLAFQQIPSDCNNVCQKCCGLLSQSISALDSLSGCTARLYLYRIADLDQSCLVSNYRRRNRDVWHRWRGFFIWNALPKVAKFLENPVSGTGLYIGFGGLAARQR